VNGGLHTHFTIFDTNYGSNPYLSGLFGLGDSSGWLSDNGMPWQFDHQPYDRRFYNPRALYELWYRN
jgi:hypothetical protein